MTYTKDNIVFVEHPKSPKFRDLTGQKFNRLTVLGYAGKRGHNGCWFCECECGAIRKTSRYELIYGGTKSCGCWNRESLRNRITHGASRKGDAQAAEYRSYQHAKARCQTPTDAAYSDYGGRGIEFRFKSYQEFIDHIGVKPTPHYSLDRINNDGHYEIGNVRWADRQTQCHNRRIKRLEHFTSQQLLSELHNRHYPI